MGMNTGNLKEEKWNWATVPPGVGFISGCGIVFPPSSGEAQTEVKHFDWGFEEVT